MRRDSSFRKPSLFARLETYTDFERQLSAIANDLGKTYYADDRICNALLDSGLIAKESVSSLGIVKWSLKDISNFLTKLTGFNCKVVKQFALPASLRYKQYAIAVYWLSQGFFTKHTFFVPCCATQEDKNSVMTLGLFKYCYFIQFFEKIEG